ncbi:phospholipid scramblase 2-like [Helicoverpa zea]|uniref:phospholipid scramblase 2-like n=1 Tax=Helicoverpa zea TaxID=7113 RepID=UPI001F592A98|nr:phospholipid scramblase 2-like [Helicoverpa zea]
MATAKDTVPGLERLIRLDSVNVNQKGSGFKGNKYIVHSGGEQLFHLKEDGHALTFLAHGSSRGFHMDGVDNLGQHVFSLRRPAVFIKDKVEVYLNKTLVSIIRKEATFVTPVFSINDGQDAPMLRIKGDMSDYDFQVQTAKKVTIGKIKKKFRGLLNEMFTYKDDYVVTFPTDLDVRFKIAVISACILIDYRYHES